MGRGGFSSPAANHCGGRHRLLLAGARPGVAPGSISYSTTIAYNAGVVTGGCSAGCSARLNILQHNYRL